MPSRPPPRLHPHRPRTWTSAHATGWFACKAAGDMRSVSITGLCGAAALALGCGTLLVGDLPEPGDDSSPDMQNEELQAGDDGQDTPGASESGSLDLLFMVDNSFGMRDKQKLFQAAMPELVRSLAERFADIHVAVVSSSL